LNLAAGFVFGWKVGTKVSDGYTATQSTKDTQSVTLNWAVTNSIQTWGVPDDFSPVDSDYDIIYVWLNPVEILTLSGTNVTWNGYGYDATDQNGMDIVGIPLGYLNGRWAMPADLLALTNRTWASGQMFAAGQSAALNSADFAQIATNDPFSNSQVDDKSQLPAGGATGGGKKGGLGGEGLEGPAPADDPNITQRLAGHQTSIRNESARVALQMHAAGFENFKLVEANAYLKKSEDAIKANQYHTAMYYQQEAVQSLNSAKVLAAGEVHVIADTSPKAAEKTQKDIDSALNGPMPMGYGDPVKAYFEKMAGQ